MTLNSTNDPGFCSTKPGAMSFQCHSLEKVFETLCVLLNKADGGAGEMMVKRKKRNKKGKKRKEKWGRKKAFILKANS